MSARWSAGAVGVYLVLGVVAYWGAWSGGAARTSICGGCGDIALNSWFLAWTPFAILHGHNPFFTTWVNYPHGANLLSNASILLPGLLAAPVTLAFGPLSSYNLLATLAFAGSATAAYFALRRFAPWPPAAFLGGLLYGFSPYMVNQGTGHVHLTLVAIPPLVLVVLDEVLVRQRGRALRWGIALGMLAVAQFFTSSEVLASTAVMALIGIVIVLVASGRAGVRLRHAATSLLVAGLVAGVLLAFPLYLLVAGPQHLVGPAQPNGAVYSANLGGPIVPPASMLLHTAGTARTSAEWFGIPDGAENDAYLGLPLLVFVAWVGVRLWRERLVRFAVLMAVIAFVLALGPRLDVGGLRTSIPLPFAIFEHVPVLQSLLAVRFMLYVVLFASLLLAVGIDRVRAARPAAHRGSKAAGWATAGLGLLALVPLVPRWPYVTQREQVPPWFIDEGVRAVPSGDVLLTYPFGPGAYGPVLWQAQANMRYRVPDGELLVPGPDGRATVNPHRSVAEAVLGDYFTGAPAPALAPDLVNQVRTDVESWDTWAVAVAPRGAAPGRAVALFRQALGEAPTWHGGVAVWTDCPASPGERLHPLTPAAIARS